MMKKALLILLLPLTLISCDFDGYGPKIVTNGVEVYYQPDDLKDQAKSFSQMLDTLGYGSEGDVSFQIVKDSIVNINMVTKDQYHTDKSLDYSLSAIGMLCGMEIFEGEVVQMHLCNDRFEKQRSLDPYRP
jgi:hypothetical protein